LRWRTTFTCSRVPTVSLAHTPSVPHTYGATTFDLFFHLCHLNKPDQTSQSSFHSIPHHTTASMAHIKYKDHSLLPADAPGGQPHILDDGEGADEIGYARLCDFVATVLHNLEGHPDALKDFFDPKVKSFKFLRIEKPLANFIPDAPLMRGRERLSRMIWRIENKVIVSLHRTSNQTYNILLTACNRLATTTPTKHKYTGKMSRNPSFPRSDPTVSGRLHGVLSQR
jgi:hypothetical protein